MSYINRVVPPPPPPDQQILVQRLIRMAFLLGLLAFGAVIWFTQRAGREPFSPDTPLTTFVPYVLGAALAGTIAMRFVVAKASDAQRPQYLLIGWAIGEAAALLGGVHWLMTGNPRWYVIGMFVFLSALVLHPLRRE